MDIGGHPARLDQDKVQFDYQSAFRQHNDFMELYGLDRFTAVEDRYYTSSIYWRKNESKIISGYPQTFYLQASLVYLCGLYTARQQGIVKRNVFFSPYWRAHYFDWTLFLRRSVLIGGFGGLALGSYIWGRPRI